MGTLTVLARSVERLSAFLVLALALGADRAWAGHPLITDDTGTVGGGVRQLELSAELARDRQGAAEERSGLVNASFGVGVLDALDMSVALPLVWIQERQGGQMVSDQRGLGDASLSLKWRCFDGEGWGLALRANLDLPTGDQARGLGGGSVAGGAVLIGSFELGRVALHWNGGWMRTPDQTVTWRASGAAVAKVLDRLQLALDSGLETDPDRISRAALVYLLAGVIYSPSEMLDLDVGMKLGLTEPEADITGLAGVTVRF